MRHAWIAVTTLGLGSGACRTSPAGEPRITGRDSAGIEIVESIPPPRDAVEPWVIDSVPLFDIGADPSDPNQEFSTPSNPVRLADGRFAVAERGTQEIRFFDRSGAWIRNVGRKGGGPGEYTDLRDLYLGPGDSLYAYEPGTGFVTVLDAGGAYGRRARPEFPAPGRFAIFSGVFANGGWLVNGSEIVRPTSAGVFRSTTTLFEYTAGGKVVDSVGSAPGGEAFGEPIGDRGWRFYLLPFARRSLTTVHGSRAFVTVTERVDVRVYRQGTGLERIVRIALAERPLTPEMVAQAVERMVAGWSRTPAADREETRRKLLDAPYPDEVPAIDALVIAANGDLWFREYPVDEDDPARFVVADSTGRWRAFAQGPARFTPSWIGSDQVIGLWRDPDDVAHVRAYRLARE